MSNATMRVAPKRKGWTINFRQVINLLFGIAAAVFIFIVFNAIIGGKCDSQCEGTAIGLSWRRCIGISQA